MSSIKKKEKNILFPLFHSPFHEQFSSQMRGGLWNDWGGYKAATVVQDEELEYFAIRSTCSLFDASPLIKYRIEGPDAEIFLNKLTLRNVSSLNSGKVQYTAWCDDEGFVLDDGTLFKFAENKFRLCCQERHLPWLLDSALGLNVKILDETDLFAALSIQGPTSAAVLKSSGFAQISKLEPFDLINLPFEGNEITISRTGFTGDLGYEIFLPNVLASKLWDSIWNTGEKFGIRAIGFNALNLARIETGFIIANTDFITSEHALREDRKRRPDEISLGWMVDLNKDHFNGKTAIINARQNNQNSFCSVALEIEGKESAEGSIIYHNKSKEVGIITSAAWSPTAKKSIALATLQNPFGTKYKNNLWVEIYALRELQYHKLMRKVTIVKRPFVKLPRRTMTPPLDF